MSTDDTSTDAVHYRLHSLEQARDRLTADIEQLKVVIGSHGARLVASETMQPVIMKQLEEIKAEVVRGNAIWSRLAWVALTPLGGALVWFITNGGLLIPGVSK